MRRWQKFLVCMQMCWLSTACSGPQAERIARDLGSTSASTARPKRCEHQLPPALCTRCQPALAAVFQSKGDWCEEHRFPESFCPVCNPSAAIPDIEGERAVPQGAGAEVANWCLEHALPESMCSKCDPSLIAHFRAQADFCEEHGFPESACPICSPQKAPAGAEKSVIEASIVRFRSPDIEDSVGIQTIVAEKSVAAKTINCSARISFDENRIADVRTTVSGIVKRVRVELGAHVGVGTPLFELESNRVGQIQGALQGARERLRAAEADLGRQRELKNKDIASARQLELAERELATARAEARSAEAALRMTGAAHSSPTGRYTLVAPIEGTVVRRPAVLGFLATQQASLATIVDTSVMWALCDVPEVLVSQVELGQKVVVRVAGREDESIEGELTWISSEVDLRTRTVTARAELPNPDGQLRANQFADAHIETGAPLSALTVPRDAIQRVGDFEVIFIRSAQGVFEPRVVKSFGDGPKIQVQGRIQAGDAVVTTGAVLLRTEIMPGSIGAGCCEVTPPGER